MEAARGTSVDDSRSGSTSAPRAWLLFACVAVVLYAADQTSKHAAVEHLSGRGGVEVVGDLLQLRLTRNPGAAFSMGTTFTVALTCLAMVATVVVLVLSRRVADRAWAVALGALLAGITGNLTDRMLRAPAPFRGHVVDFLELPNWPIFNVADISINIGVALILLQVFRGIRMDGTRHERDADHGPRSDPGRDPGRDPEREEAAE